MHIFRSGKTWLVRLLAVISILVVSLVVGLYLVRKSSAPSATGIDANVAPAIESDVILQSVDQYKEKYPKQEDLVDQLLLAAERKEVFKKTDEALHYMEAAVAASESNSELKKSTQHSVYLFALRTENTQLVTKYRQLLGDDYIRTKAEEAKRYDSSR